MTSAPIMPPRAPAVYGPDAVAKLWTSRQLDAEEAEALRGIPGTKVSPWGLKAPIRAAEFVRADLRRMGIESRITGVAGNRVAPDFRATLQALVGAGVIRKTFWNDWLRAFQKAIVRDRFATSGGHVHSPTGSGKTAMSLLWAWMEPGPSVAVTMTKNRGDWCEEARNAAIVGVNAPRVFELLPASAVRKKHEKLDDYLNECAGRGQAPFLVVGWETLNDFLPLLLTIIDRWGRLPSGGFQRTSVIFDESQYAANPDRLKWHVTVDDNGRENFRSEQLDHRSTAAEQLARRCARRLATTATPIGNRTVDLWGQLTLVEPDAWGVTASRFRARYCDEIPGEYGGYVPRDKEGPGTSNEDELAARMNAIRTLVPMSVTHAELPPRRRKVIWVEPEDQVRALPGGKSLLKDAQAEAKKQGVRADRALKERLVEIRADEAASRKRRFALSKIDEFLSAGAGKVLVFAGRKRDCDELGEKTEAMCRKRFGVEAEDGSSGRVWIGHGDHPIEARREMRRAFMAHPGPCVLVATWHAFGEGLNIQDADALLWVRLPTTPRELIQGSGRPYRLGMKRPLLEAFLVGRDTIDVRLRALLLEKLPAVQRFSDETALEGVMEGLNERDSAKIMDALCAFLADLPEVE